MTQSAIPDNLWAEAEALYPDGGPGAVLALFTNANHPASRGAISKHMTQRGIYLKAVAGKCLYCNKTLTGRQKKFCCAKHGDAYRPRRVEGRTNPDDLTEEQITEQVHIDLAIEQAEAEARNSKRRYAALIKTQAFEDRVITEIGDALKALPTVRPPKPHTLETGTSDETLVLLFSDQHIGEVVSVKETDGFGGYDFDTFVARTELMVDKVLSIRNRLTAGGGYRLDHLVIAALGDAVSGNIHDELRETNDPPITEAVIEGGMICAQMTRELAREFATIDVLGVVGNHGRLTRKPAGGKRKYDNWDRVLYHTWEGANREQTNVSFQIPRSPRLLHNIRGHQFLFMHGDSIRGSLGIPWYGVTRADHRLSTLYGSRGDFYTYLCIGHFHDATALGRVKGRVFINGTVKGGDEYALNSLHTSGDPEQMLLGVDEEHGVTFEYKLNLLNAGEPERYQWRRDDD